MLSTIKKKIKPLVSKTDVNRIINNIETNLYFLNNANKNN